MYKKYSTKKTEMHINQIQVQHAYNKDYYLYNIENMQGKYSLYVYGWAFVCEYEHVYVCACVCVCVRVWLSVCVFAIEVCARQYPYMNKLNDVHIRVRLD